VRQRFELLRRVEPRQPTGDLGDGFAARLGDPLWLLGRQWQLGEHQGENASSPVAVDFRVATAPLKAPRSRPGVRATVVPTESIVEGEPEDWWTPARRIRIGRAAAQLLPKPPPPNLALRNLPAPYDVHTGYDGLEVWRKRARLGLPPSLFAEVPRRRGSHWSPADLVYEARLPCGDGELAVSGHDGTEIDWWSADATKPVTLKPGPKQSAIPARFEYPGAPHPRWWQIEDRSVDIGGYPPDRGHLATLLLIDLISSHANDWFVWGLEVPGASVAALRDVRVWDVFGRQHEPVVPSGWSLYAVEGLGPATVFIPQTTATPLVGDAQDEAALGVDEDSNLLWGAVLRRDGLLVPATAPGASVPVVEGTPPAAWRYTPSTAVPSEWHPYRVPDAGTRRRFVEQRLAELNATPPKPAAVVESDLLGGEKGPPHAVEPAAVPASGLRLDRRWVLARGTDGRPVLWLQRTRTPLAGPPSKTLRFDVLERT